MLWKTEVDKVVAQVPEANDAGERFVVGVAGPPAAGKSTFASELKAALGSRAAELGMDAFHFDDAILEARGDRSRKGAPHTFDVEAYRFILEACLLYTSPSPRDRG